MQNNDWRNTTIKALILGVLVYLVMRFLVPHSIDNDSRSLIGGAVAFVLSLIIGRVATRSTRA
jgi:hypothetical protein